MMKLAANKSTTPPLQAALAEVKAHHARLAVLARESVEVAEQIETYIASGTPGDAARNVECAGLRVRLDCIPAVVTRVEASLAEHTAALITEIELFERQLAKLGQTERTALLEKIEKLLAPFNVEPFVHLNEVQNPARCLAASCGIFNGIPTSLEAFHAPCLDTNSNNGDVSRSAIARADALLSIAADQEKRGTFVPKDWQKA